MDYTQKYHSPIGNITVASNGEKITGLWFDDGKFFGETLSTEVVEKKIPVLEETKKWLDCYFDGKNPQFTPPVYLSGSPFRLAVWEILKSIPYGKVMTYGQIATIIARRRGIENMSSQAVGGAVGHNPISVIIPCHRVVGSNGNLTGYAGGIDKKIKLLTIEGVDMTKLFLPIAKQ